MADTGSQTPTAAPPSSYNNQNQSYAQHQISQYHQQSASPGPIQYNQYASHSTPNLSQSHHNNSNSSYHSSHVDHYPLSQSRYPHTQPSYRSSALPGSTANSVRPHDVYRLSEQANSQIPAEVRQQFQQDEQGNVLFFTAPPLDVLQPMKEGFAVGHTARYLAEKARRQTALREKRKAQGITEDEEEPLAKKPKSALQGNLSDQIHGMRDRALSLWVEQMQEGTARIYQDIYGSDWEKAANSDAQTLARKQKERILKQTALEAARKQREEKSAFPLAGSEVFLDDFNPRY
ncbi:MAG: hypothetical protein Q9214_003017 [Letrouitia sp. 1 TL-2023]